MDEFIHQLEDKAVIDNFNILDEKFIHHIPSSCERAGNSVALFTESGMKSVGSTKSTMDGTFKFFPNFVKQLFIIHCFVGKFVSF